MSTDAHQAAPTALDAVRRGEILTDVAALRDSFDAGTTRPPEARIAQLDALAHGLRAERPRLLKALELDLGKSRTESLITELGVVAQETAHLQKNLRACCDRSASAPACCSRPPAGRSAASLSGPR